jgi:beta-fructofuranosidase
MSSTVRVTISVNKSRSTSDPNIRNCPEQGPFTLFYKTDCLGICVGDYVNPQGLQFVFGLDPQTISLVEESKRALFVQPKDKLETLRIHIISDADTLEVFANDRFALATIPYIYLFNNCTPLFPFGNH